MEEKPVELPVSPQEIQIQPSSFLDKLKIHKFKILVGILGVLVLAGAVFGAYKFGQRSIFVKNEESARQAFPLDDVNATYRINKLNQRFTLSYTKDNQIQEIYIGKSLVNLEQYVNKKVLVEGEFRTEEQQVQCFKAPCPPVKVIVLDIYKVQVVD